MATHNNRLQICNPNWHCSSARQCYTLALCIGVAYRPYASASQTGAKHWRYIQGLASVLHTGVIYRCHLLALCISVTCRRYTLTSHTGIMHWRHVKAVCIGITLRALIRHCASTSQKCPMHWCHIKALCIGFTYRRCRSAPNPGVLMAYNGAAC